jgi:hypothetical protein
VPRSVHAPLLEMATFRNHFGDTPVEQQAPFPQLPTYRLHNNHNAVWLYVHALCGTTRECTAESHGEEQQHCKDERDDQSIPSAVSDHAMDIAPNISVFENASTLLQTEPLEIDTRVGSDTDQLIIWSKIENIGLARAVTVQLCPPPT